MAHFRWRLVTLLFITAISAASGADPTDVLLPNEKLKLAFKDDAPIVYITRNSPEWQQLPAFWNDSTQEVVEPNTGAKITRKVVKIKLPLGLSTAPVVPAENPLTVAKWNLGKKLYFDNILSTDNTVACASCHNPAKGYTDQSQFSTGINNNLGGANAPTVLNSAFNKLQFWDGRAASLEDQAQGPPGNPKEMFSGKGDPWTEAITRIRANPDYVKAFEQVFGHAPTRDAAAKAIATYERTVLGGNSIFDRAEAAMKKRVAAEDDGGKPEMKGVDFAVAIKDAVTKKDTNSLSALGTDGADADALGQRLVNGRNLFFGKARCTTCHIGENFTDNLFHNLGVGAKDGQLPKGDLGRFGSQPTGHKDPTQMGAFKTPGLRGLKGSAPYMHDGSEKTLEEVVEFYDRGGNANPYLDEKMRDTAAELSGKGTSTVMTVSGRPIIPLKLNLTKVEKADIVLFMKSLEGDPVDPMVADPTKFAK